MKTLLLFVSLIFVFSARSQDSIKNIPAVRLTSSIKIDGILNDEAWKTAPSTDEFIEQRPSFLRKEDPATKTEFKILYDDIAVYISGTCKEKRDSISSELTGRDNPGINDIAGVMFDTYRDKINGVGFYVTALGEQYDCKYSLGNENGSWSAVYYTATHITNEGWTFEMKIPYSALRFSKNEVQTWGLNFIRRRAKAGRQFSWSPIDPNKFGLINQAGLLTGISNIKSPIRLSLSPYFSTYYNHTYTNNGLPEHQTVVNGGMDIKYGVSKGFTLDMTLIPDFGQVQSDNQILNLTPFEIRYNENRPFFTEGTELFTKGNLFYSRRIGGTPLHYYDAFSPSANDSLLENPSETKLVNATKFSGRTSKGLGIGIFNAITKPQYAKYENTLTHEHSTYETDPWTNYNILVLDQTMKNNSSITLTNTDVLRSGKDYDANVTSLQYDLYDNNIAWNVWGKFANSRLYGLQDKVYSGTNIEVNVGRFKGPLNFELHQYVADNKYQQNDLGYFTNNNYSNSGFNVWYKLTKPKNFYNNMYFSFGGNYSMRYIPREFQAFELYSNYNMQFKNFWSVSVNNNFSPEQNDFYEPRKNGWKFRKPGSWRQSLGLSTNSTKKYYVSVNAREMFSAKYKSHFSDISLFNRYRFNTKFTVSLSNYFEFGKNNAGYASPDSSYSNIYFGLRDQHTVENVLSLKYNFNIKMGLTLGLRHYWSKVDYHKYLLLDESGRLEETSNISLAQNPDNNVNFFNIDMIYTWQFAQGSFINLSWKNAGFQYNQDVNAKYRNNLENILKQPHQNNLSVKVIYYLDYLSLKKNKHTS